MNAKLALLRYLAMEEAKKRRIPPPSAAAAAAAAEAAAAAVRDLGASGKCFPDLSSAGMFY